MKDFINGLFSAGLIIIGLVVSGFWLGIGLHFAKYTCELLG